MVQLGQKGRPFTTRLPYFMENVTTKSFGVELERTFIGGFGLDSSLVDSRATIFSQCKRRTGFLRVIKFADVKKNVITSADVQLFA